MTMISWPERYLAEHPSSRSSLFIIGRICILAILLCCTVIAAYSLIGRPGLAIDDADIFIAYGQHAVAGRGLVYTLGEGPVEGFSSPLWQLIVIVAYTINLAPKLCLLAVSILVMAVALGTLWHAIDGPTPLSLAGLLLLIWVFSAPAFIIWTSVTLMDTALWTSVLIIGTVLALYRTAPYRLGIVIGIL